MNNKPEIIIKTRVINTVMCAFSFMFLNFIFRLEFRFNLKSELLDLILNLVLLS